MERSSRIFLGPSGTTAHRRLLNAPLDHIARIMKAPFAALLFCILTLSAAAQEHRAIEFPDVEPYVTLVCDFHMHTVFSDGSVWPNIRVQEAIRDALDAIAVTEHLEYQPYRADIPHPDRNRSHQVATQSAQNEELIVINGSEITRSLPPGHLNAIFLEDANALVAAPGEDALDPMDVFREARRQDAFVFWNHPNWVAQSPSGVAELTEMHHTLIAEGLMQGIEIANEQTYSDEALQIALDHNLTLLGTSDIHGLVDWEFDVPGGGHRPVTLVFAAERTADGIKEALVARRTAVWFRNTLIGRAEHLMPLLEASVQVTAADFLGSTSVLRVTIANHSDAELILRNTSDYTLHESANLVTLPPHGATDINVKTLESPALITLSFEVLSALTAPGTHPSIDLEVNASP